MNEKTVFFTPGSEGLLSPLKAFFEDKTVSEILINRPGEVFVERAGLMERHHLPVLDTRLLKNLFTFIANENGRALSEQSPLLSGSLTDGSRVQLVLPPAAKYHTLSVRRASLLKRTLADYATSSFYDEVSACDIEKTTTDTSSGETMELQDVYQQSRWADFLKRAIEYKKNIVISGATSSGKTTFLNACAAHIPHHERIITLEDSYEVDIPHNNIVRMLAPKKTSNQQPGLCMQDLLQCALRLRPDRLIMGEIRGREILDFIAACSTGHEGSITSIHANNPATAFMRMTQLYKQNNVPSMRDEDILRELHAVIDIVVQVTRTEKGRAASFIYYRDALKHPLLQRKEETPNRVHDFH